MPKSMPSLTGTGFAPAPTTVNPRLILSVQGLEKNGKTHFALTAPGPIAVINFDTGLEGVVHKFATEKQIVHADYRVEAGNGSADTIAGNAQKVWAKYMADYKWALANMRTIVIDTGSELWELLRLARFGKLTQVMPHHYGPVNNEFRQMVKMAYDGSANVIFLHKMKDEYLNTVNSAGKEISNKTGKKVRVGFSDIGYLVQSNLLSEYDPEAADFQITIRDCRQNASLNGEVVPAPLNDFPTIAQMILPDSLESDWV